MAHQSAVTVRAVLQAGHAPQVRDLLDTLRRDGLPEPTRSAVLADVHFARLFVLERTTDLQGNVIPESLVYMADVDGSVGRHLRTLAHAAGPWVDELLQHCVDYPDDPSVAERLRWLRDHHLQPAAQYVHRVGRTVGQVRDEARLRGTIENLLDAPGTLDGATEPAAVRRRIRDIVLGRPDLAWAGRRAAGPGLLFQLRERARFVLIAAGLLATLPVLVPTAAVWLVLIRLQEETEDMERGAPPLAHVDAVRQHEDFGAQNPFTGCGFIKRSTVRRVTMRVGLFGLDYANRHLFARDNLAGVRSIHFARWVPIDEGRRLIFASSYDGTLESYMDDFISRLALGINLIFTNGVGFPRARWLVFGGARDEISYKHYLRRHMVPTTVFYSAYPELPAPNVDANSAVREGLARDVDVDDPADAEHWLALL